MSHRHAQVPGGRVRLKGKALKKWLEYERFGEVIADTFLPFKTPLDEDYDRLVTRADRFTPEMILQHIHTCQLPVGLILDLTKVNYPKYYYPSEFEKHDIRHHKIMIKAFDKCPTKQETRYFIGTCKSYLQSSPNGVIGVHCTHGSNRTGFLICAYLIEEMGYTVQQAVQLFRDKRPPGISKNYLIDGLFERYQQHI